MGMSGVSLRYKITMSKDHAQVTAAWDVAVDMSDEELISSFVLEVGAQFAERGEDDQFA